jgi:prolyl-tRNA synthetase
VMAEIGDDYLLISGDYAANVEMALATPPAFPYEQEKQELQKVATPATRTIEELSNYLHLPPQRILKTVLYKLLFADHAEFVAICIRGDRQINSVKVEAHFGAIEVELANEEEVRAVTGSPPGFVGPLSANFRFMADESCRPMTNFVCGSNEIDMHYINVNWERDLPLPEFHDFLLAEAGDHSPHAPGEVYTMQRGIEVGHIFNLGTRYTEALGAFYQDEQGETKPIWMGTYGIGIGRAAAAIVEQKHDEKGIIWPMEVAPFRILVTAALYNDERQFQAAEEIYKRLKKQQCEPLFDNREERLGLKLKDSDLMGIPYKLIVGKAYLQEKKVEIESRLGEKILLPEEALLDWTAKHLCSF